MKKLLAVATVAITASGVFGQTAKPLPTIKGLTLGQPATKHVDGDCHAGAFNDGRMYISCTNQMEGSELTLDYDKNDKLEFIDYTVSGTWDLMSPSLIAKFGKPSSVRTKVVQNGFGAKFLERHALWVTSQYVVSADEGFKDDSTAKSKQVDIRYQTRASFNADMKSVQKEVAGQLD